MRIESTALVSQNFLDKNTHVQHTLLLVALREVGTSLWDQAAVETVCGGELVTYNPPLLKTHAAILLLSTLRAHFAYQFLRYSVPPSLVQ